MNASRLAGDVDALAEGIIREVSFDPVTLHVDALALLKEPDPAGTTSGQPALLWEFRLPFVGSPDVLLGRSRTMTVGQLPNGRIMGEDLAIEMVLPADATDEQVRSSLKQEINGIETHLSWGNKEVADARAELLTEVQTLLRQRAASASGGRAVAQSLGIPLLRRGTAPVVPLERKVLPLPGRPAGGTPSPLEHARLQDDAYESILSTIESFGRALERIPKTFAGLAEEELRDFLLVILNASFKGAAAGEVFNRDGKTDILLRHDDTNLFIGECKIWKGTAAADAALETQLFNYVAWRDTSAALILFIRQTAKPTALIRKAYDLLAGHERLVATPPEFTAGERHDFRLQHPEDPARVLRVALLTFVVPHD